MAEQSQTLEAKLDDLRRMFAINLPARITQIQDVWIAAGTASHSGAEYTEFLRLVHSLAGSGSTFGLPAITDVGRQIEDLLNRDHAPALEPDIQAKVDELLGSLQGLAADAANGVGLSPLTVLAPANQVIATDDSDVRTVYVVDDDAAFANQLSAQIAYFGYTVETYYCLSDLSAAVARRRPSAIVIDMAFPEGPMAGAELMQKLQAGSAPIPVAFVSSRDDLESRLSAVRGGGIAYCLKPVDIGLLIDRLDANTARYEVEAYRVLIVDDSATLGAYYQAVLQNAGVSALHVARPQDVLRQLVEFRPDLVLMDLYMPGCSGLELAMVIHQHDAYIGLPIVYLSAERDMEKHIEVLSSGGDDFLTKPIDPRHLLSVVITKARRARQVRTLMERDSLTGLLNHSRLKERLAQEVSRALRQRSNLAFAMIDIDLFKHVNDNYGHPAGDRVIKSLARLLHERLRHIDIVGRYGGEELAAILVDTDVAAATAVIDDLRESFGAVRQTCDDRSFNVTFSAGIAGFPQFSSASAIIDAADKALYQAKRQGRNRVVNTL